jgi:carboxyl-terminal processing protease
MFTDVAIRAILNELNDPYSGYDDEEAALRRSEPMRGNYYGIGVSFEMLADTLYIFDVVSDGPAQKAGVMSGDRIIYINDTLVANVKMNKDELNRRLRGEKGTEIDIKVLRRDVSDLMNFQVICDAVPVFSILATYMVTDNIGYIRLNHFGDTSVEEFKKAIQELKTEGMENLIIDLINNGGGRVAIAIEIANEFLEKERLISYTRMKNEESGTIARHGGEMLTGRVVVLVNEITASASETFAGAIQDWDRGIIVGERTRGKGSSQHWHSFDDGSMLRLTFGQRYTPAGRRIQRPYKEDDSKARNQDIMTRFLQGKTINEDEIHLIDSLKFTTLINERTVFGGGGIIPDYLVPVNVIVATRLYAALSQRGIINRTAMSEVDVNRNELLHQFPNAQAFQNNFQVPQSMFDRMRKFAKNDNIVWDDVQFEESRSDITKWLRSIMIRDLYDSSADFLIWNEGGYIFQEGLRIISDPERYENLLKGVGGNVRI